ncbi:ATP phosphoribosyltransferase regulatory subunit [Eubacterium sp. An3]|uniref:ATP phosphoribosyltransferase regulatory subunit n=1 Tax=Eubacterium sp. An3 TaxID=1965628 RepID=UPI0007A7DA62|nr:ATP phosphoribosyltransferase regulatory subunit [Eubacterium sp. An3]OUO28093.1 ATP phosphoribosyltransferase regulatory subunit [Eubacterium sp. An3]CVI73347.1 ATP phosphoribosyltransferase regulatory subunit [Eubacteriaceae bacterium CHKCI004]
MKEKLLHTPEGVRDIYNSECKKKTALERRLHQVLALYGYQDIETPAFEFFDIFNSDTGTVSSREMFKFFDRDNNTLVLRPDMTPSIARSVAKYYSDCTFPLRLSYVGNTFLNNRSYQGKLAEKTELGAEYINDDSPEADAEAIVMMIDCFLEAGLNDFRIDIGQSEFYRGIMEALDVSDEVKAQIHEYIENKNSLGMELLLADLPMKDCYRNILLEYNELYGDVSMLEQAKKLTVNPRCQAAIERLEQVYEVICHYGYEKYVSFDLGMVNHFDYYTGIIFRGYTYGTGDAIGKGGRYDNLLMQFGKNAPAIGFTILVDDMLSALDRQNIPVSIREFEYSVLLYNRKDMSTAIGLAMEMRTGGDKLECICMKEDQQAGDYISFAKAQGARAVFVLDGDALIIHDFSAGRVAQTSLTNFRREY